MTIASNRVCLWCRKSFVRRQDGGKAQRFCRPACRRAFDRAGRRWVIEAITTGTLTVHALNKGAPATRALVPAATSSIPAGQYRGHVVPYGDSLNPVQHTLE